MYVANVKATATNGIIMAVYPNMVQTRCVDYEPKEEFEGYKKPLTTTAKREKSIMGFTQEFYY